MSELIYTEITKISGWILPDASWRQVDEWWHISGIYDLHKEKNVFLQDAKTKLNLKIGKEEDIRAHVASLGFIKFSRGQIDALSMTKKQLLSVKNLISTCHEDEKLSFFHFETENIKHFFVSQILKIQNPLLFF